MKIAYGTVCIALFAAICSSAMGASFVQVDQVDGSIVDVSADRILFKKSRRLHILDRSTREVVDIPPVEHVDRYEAAYLAPNGAIYQGNGRELHPNKKIYQWDGVTNTFRGSIYSTGTDLVAAPGRRYVGWFGSLPSDEGPNTIRFDTTDASYTTLQHRNSNIFAGGISRNGDIAFYEVQPWNIWRFHNDSEEQLTSEVDTSSAIVELPITDGTNVVFLRRTKIHSDNPFERIMLFSDETGLIELTARTHGTYGPRSHSDPLPGYRLNSGWIANLSLNLAGDAGKLRLRSPRGRNFVLADINSTTAIEGISANGEVIFREGEPAVRYLAIRGEAPVNLGPAFGEVEIIKGVWHVIDVGTLYQLVP